MYTKFSVAAFAVLVLAGCQPTVPDSGAGVGFGSYTEYEKERAARDAQLQGRAVPAPNRVSTEPLPSATGSASAPLDATASEAQQIASATTSALNTDTDPNVVQASPSNPAPVVVTASGISNENDFNAVGERRTIADDAARIAQNRAQYQVVQPTALPSRVGSGGPNIVEYALSSNNPKGVSVYRRNMINAQTKFNRNCAKYPSPDMAQTDFLAQGGPKKDRMGLDPDGDGYACSWDPAPFRKAVGG